MKITKTILAQLTDTDTLLESVYQAIAEVVQTYTSLGYPRAYKNEDGSIMVPAELIAKALVKTPMKQREWQLSHICFPA